ncbi:transporter substrate-binding domain-containing protein [Legionella fairfieldensis]|uniref:transporter substrate-binding domain-containing protein n=1 Tax=Legionella fairfieldensis TaxID=45064 RepID=UPI0004907CDC|nr:transporter substrate-binding domain-containing protein [Legionella fairfieldensis]
MKHIRNIFLLLSCFFFSTLGYGATKIGMLLYDPPYVISPKEGFDVDLSRILCIDLKLSCQFIFFQNSQALYDALKSGQVDLALSGITISSSREKNFLFSLPYMLSQGQFMTLKKSGLQSVDDLNGTTVGVIKDTLSGGVLYSYLNNNFQGKFKITQYDNVEDMLSALSNNTISAVFLYRSDVNYWNHNSGNVFQSLGPVVTLGKGLAIMTTPKNENLINQINNYLQRMEKDNTYLNLYRVYFSNQ